MGFHFLKLGAEMLVVPTASPLCVALYILIQQAITCMIFVEVYWHINFSCVGLPWWAQWLRIRLPMQGTWVQTLGLYDPTCHRATKPVSHKY